MQADIGYALFSKISGKKIVVFGGGLGGAEFIRQFSVVPDYIIDNNEQKWGQTHLGVEVKPPHALKQESKDDLAVIIASGAVEAMEAQLQEFGLVSGEQIFISPLIVNELGLSMFRHPRLLVSSIGKGGGLYVVDPNTSQVEKVYDGNCRGIEGVDGDWLVALEFEGVVRLDREFNEISRIKFEDNRNLHGLSMGASGEFYLNETRNDVIGVYDAKTFEKMDEIMPFVVEDKGIDAHHINDVFFYDGKLYCTMFSYNGVWKHEIWDDGRLVCIDPKTGAVERTLIRGLSQPHSVMIEDSIVHLCNSMQCCVQRGNDVLCQMMGYTRGLCRKDEFFYIGQSKMLRLSRFADRFSNIFNECGVFVWNSKLKTSTFIPVQANGVFDIAAIHDEQ